MPNVIDGTIKVPQRAADGSPTGHEVELLVGDALWTEVDRGADYRRSHESNAVKRYIANQGADIQDIVEHLADGPMGSLSVDRFLTHTGLRPFFSPIVEDGLRIGLDRVAPNWEGLIAQTIQVDQLTYEYYEFDAGTPPINNAGGIDEFRLRKIGQGAPIPTARVTSSGKSYTLYKQGRGIEWTDESKLAPIDLAVLWFQQVGLQLGWDYHDQIVDALLNGYFADGSDDAPVIATGTPAVIDDADLYTAQLTLQVQYGYDAKVMLMSQARAVAIQTLENGAGQRLFPQGVEAAGLPPIRIAQSVPDDKIIFADTDYAMVRFVNKEFGTEFDRRPQVQIEGSYGTSIELTAPLFKNARVILDS
jgi:hypothetical protein